MQLDTKLYLTEDNNILSVFPCVTNPYVAKHIRLLILIPLSIKK